MATSGSLTTTKYDGRYYKLAWERTSYSVANNTSTIKWTLSAVGGNNSWYAERTLKVVVAGKTVKDKTSRVEREAETIDSGTITISHNADGTKSFSASIKAAVYTSEVNCTGSKTFTLTAIPRKATVESAPDFNDEGNPAITYKNPAGSVVDKLEACIANSSGNILVAYRTINKTGTLSYTFNLTDTERTALRKYITTGNSATVRFYVRTTIGDSTYTSYLSKTLSLVNYTPTLNPTVKDTGSSSLALTGNENTIIKGFNVISVSSGAAARKNATISSQKITCGSESISSGSGTFDYVESATFKFSVTDSRGYTTTKTITKTLINYIPITCSFQSNVGVDGIATVTAKGNCFNGSFGKVSNTLTVQYRYKLKDSDTWGAWTTMTDVSWDTDHTYDASVDIEGLDYSKAYNFQVRATDKINTATPNSKSVKSSPVFDWGEENFHFHVPVLAYDGDKSYNISAIGKALFENTNLPCTVTPGANYTEATGNVYIIGNQLRIYFSATRNAEIAAGNNDNETICSFSVDTGGRVVGCYTVYNICANNNSCIYLGSANVDGNTLTFNIMLSSVGIKSNKFLTYFAAPVRIDLSKF